MPRGRPRKNPVVEKAAEKKKPQVLGSREAQTAAAQAAWRKYTTAEELREAVRGYFADCDARGALYGEAGLALWLDVSLDTLHSWFDGRYAVDLQPEIQRAYLKIQNQVETDPAYQDKAMTSRAIFLMKQMRLGGKVDKVESKQDIAVKVKMGKGMDEQDFG